jgi:hypothetical protein
MKTTTSKTQSNLTKKDLLKARQLKLEAKRNHIKNLVSKKTRLEIEIKGALRSLKKDLRKNGKSLREAADLSEDAEPKELNQHYVDEAKKDSEIESVLHEIDDLQTEIIYLCKSDEILSEDDRSLLNSLF